MYADMVKFSDLEQNILQATTVLAIKSK